SPAPGSDDRSMARMLRRPPVAGKLRSSCRSSNRAIAVSASIKQSSELTRPPYNPAMRRPLLLLSLICCILLCKFATAHDADLTKPAAEMAAAGTNFWQTLSLEQQQRAMFTFTDDERLNWAFVPKTRKGLPFKDMTPAQHDAAIALLKAGVSQRGFEKADAIMNRLEAVLHDLEGNPSRDSGLYFVTLFGKPEA